MIEIRFSLDNTSAEDVAQHLFACDQAFIPPLSERLDIKEYVAKLAAHATRFEAWSGNELVGLVAVYCNASGRSIAFITSVSILSQHRGRGIAAQLLARCIAHCGKLGFRQIVLEVSSNNKAALALYTRFGFVSTQITDNLTSMRMDLQEDIR